MGTQTPASVTIVANAIDLFSRRADNYARFIRLVRYPQGLRDYFLRSPILRSGMRILDAGCGTGALLLAVREALVRRALTPSVLHGFDLTPAMLTRLHATLHAQCITDVATIRADALRLDLLPTSWKDYNLVVSASMLEYIARERFAEALAGLRGLLAPEGRFILFITRRNWFTIPVIGRWWQSNLYDKSQLSQAFREAGFQNIVFGAFPPTAPHLSLWGYVVEATH